MTGVAAAAALLSVAGDCVRHRPAVADARVAWAIVPDPPAQGSAILRLTLADAAGRAISGARLRLEGNMSHPGMEPQLAAMQALEPGRYEGRFTFTMGGDWILLVTGELTGGFRLEQRIDVHNVRSAD